MHSVFVYGTLKKGFPNHDRIFSKYEIKITEAWVYGELYELGWGFPAMATDHEHGENKKVYGELIEFSDPNLSFVLDRLEGFKGKGDKNNFYNRVQWPVYTQSERILTWIYVLNHDECVAKGFRKLPSGIWQ